MHISMIKLARKPSTDPVQEKLRQNKALWNKDVSLFINDLINFKKTMNGAPSKFFMEKSLIKEPIPADPATIIGTLAGDFQELTQKGNGLITQQLEYSKTRRKKQPKTEIVPEAAVSEPVATSPDLSKQLAAFQNKYDLVSEASNPITRFFTRLITPTRGISEAARVRRYRMSLLNACVKTYRELNKLQVAIVGSSTDSIEKSNLLLRQSWNDWMLVYRGFSTYKNNMPPTIGNPGGIINKPIEEFQDYEGEQKFTTEEISPPIITETDSLKKQVNAIISDFNKNYSKLYDRGVGLDSKTLSSINDTISFFKKSPPTSSYNQSWANKLIKEYSYIMSVINSSVGSNENSMGDIVKKIDQEKKQLDRDRKQQAPKESINKPSLPLEAVQLEAVAQKFLKKWLGKARHQIFTGDTSSYRLDIYQQSKDIRKIIDRIMDSLQKDMDVIKLDPLISQVSRQMTNLRGLMRALHLSGTNKTK